MISVIGLNAQGKYEGKFEQLGTTLPTPNSYRTASGSPGPEYWQQKADYVIEAELNDEDQSITGSETITYYNNSPETLKYLWVQLDQNMRGPDSDTPGITTSVMLDTMPDKTMTEHSPETATKILRTEQIRVFR